jgi:hypothetical protein
MTAFVNRSLCSALLLSLTCACSGAVSDPGDTNPGGLGNAPGTGGASAGSGNPNGGQAGSNAAAGTSTNAGSAGTGVGGSATSAGASGSSSGSTGMAGAGGSTAQHAPPKSPTASLVYIDGYRLMVGKRASDGSLASPTPYEVRGVSWSPTGVGETNSSGYSKLYIAHGGTDVPLIAGLHANTVKTYDPFDRSANGTALLDQLYASGVMVIMTVIATHGTSQADYTNSVNYFKNHPAILAWMVGNEFNYNNLYGAPDLNTAIGLVNTAVNAIHAADSDHPVFVSHGEIPPSTTYNAIAGADMWSINLYPNLDLVSRFTAWGKLSPKPMIVGEYGADAFNNNSMVEDQAMQSTATNTLTTQIMQHYSAIMNDVNHPVVGGTIYELSDEWWKDKNGSSSTHDNGGFSNAIYSDGFANEEWWGLCTTQRVPRTAYTTLAGLYGGP